MSTTSGRVEQRNEPADPALRENAAPRNRHRPERLERIAAYARCGYFHMGYTMNLFPFVAEMPLD